MNAFIDEVRAYELMRQAGLRVPRHVLIQGPTDLAGLSFKADQPVALKAIVQGLWHKSDLGLVRFASFDPERILDIAEEMQQKSDGQGVWKGLLVMEQVAFSTLPGLPSEALLALKKNPEAGWVVVMGFGGVQADAWSKEIPPMLWPVAFTKPGQALEELKQHHLGRIWLGTLRQGNALTGEEQLKSFFQGVWQLVDVLEREGIGLLELNPLVLDEHGWPVPLDGVGEGRVQAEPELPRWEISSGTLHRLLVEPDSIAVAGISSHEGSPGRVILRNLSCSTLEPSQILPIKPGEKELLGYQAIEGVESLQGRNVQQLILSLPAAKALRVIEQLCEQGGGAEVVYLVSGGFGDGADQSGRGFRLEQLLASRRDQGQWTPVIMGPNGVGWLSSDKRVSTLFIPQEKLPFLARGGPLALLSQSGAFLLSCLSKHPHLPLRYGASIGNQLDLGWPDFLGALACDRHIRVIACYVEGFRPGDLQRMARCISELKQEGKRVLIYKGGRSKAGQVAARSHTGAAAGDWDLQHSLLERAGAILAPSVEEFDAVMRWLGAKPEGRPSSIAMITNAGYEAVMSADLLGNGLRGHALDAPERETLKACLVEHGLQDLVAPRLPLDLTPMAGERAFLDCVRLLVSSAADTVLIGLVPFTQYLETQDEGRMKAFAAGLASIARASGKRMGVAVDGGTTFHAYRLAFMDAALPVFPSMEHALKGLKLLAR